MRSILSPAPLDLVDLLFYFEGLEVVEFRFMGLELCVELILAGFLLLQLSRPSTRAMMSMKLPRALARG